MKSGWKLLGGGLLAVTLLGLSGLQARADDAGDKKDWGAKRQDRMMEHMKDALDLSDDQVQKLKDAKKSDGEAMRSLREKMTLDRDTLKLLLDKKSSDDDLKPVLADVKSDMKAMQEQREQNMEAMAAILTPTQQAKAFFMMQHGMRGHGANWGGHDMGADKDDAAEAPAAGATGGLP